MRLPRGGARGSAEEEPPPPQPPVRNAAGGGSVAMAAKSRCHTGPLPGWRPTSRALSCGGWGGRGRRRQRRRRHEAPEGALRTCIPLRDLLGQDTLV
ncbi:Hypothetical predicted protein [Podarcis lilfordi]|uniref:Uncharacterized protein n=1 Tax=Podarcis lilfordi TaxID=74358 RepID=A0AA35KYC0_9SAUR|nr:Hypothetical predicted protein [Podarcis lilfordi]